MLVDRRKVNRQNIYSSGIEEIPDSVEQLLDKLLSEMDHCKEERRCKTDDLTKREVLFTAAGEQIKHNAVARR